MKKLFIALTAFISFSAQAQKNTLLEQSFWQTKPDVAQIKAEVDKGNSPSELNRMSFDPVVMAINAEAPTESIKYLLAQPGNEIGKLTHDARTYLHWAANRGNVEVMEYLVSKGAKLNIEDSHGTTPMLFAAGSGQQNTKVYDVFITNGIDLKKELGQDGANILLLSVAGDKDFALTNYFVSKGLKLSDTDAEGNNVFSYAARSGNIEMLKALIQKGVKPNANAMLMAAQGSRRSANTLEVYQYLESLNLKPTVIGKNGENVLHSIVRKQKQNEIISYFLAKGVDINQADEEGNTVFMNASAANRDIDVINMLLPKVKNINQANEKGITALAFALRNNSPEVVNLLIAKGAAINVSDKAGNGMAYYVLESYRTQNAQGFGGQGPAAGPQGGRAANGPKAEDFDTKLNILKEKGLNIAAQQKNGNTLYHLAVAKNSLPLLKHLKPLAIDVNAKNAEGMTALHKAALIAKDDVMLKYLISIGAKKEIATDMKETAFDLASENESLSKNNVPVNFLK
ncbi:ankyrin repeat domain-containing protein [Pedobacter sp. MC2016-14]|uniref:ankyrin repeat domain-containing protein n=1 Tax=Pedobacter sp. MC2016-14 TaxID=2897327 RepID=UPI001E475115|nr:ankyrin repeat domain-containing protein [Pedobacter sp. MC2016-14]MCD0488656.1 ankyrin repeat domain-containing protein [Pedobacter sp. MC2016-14]